MTGRKVFKMCKLNINPTVYYYTKIEECTLDFIYT